MSSTVPIRTLSVLPYRSNNGSVFVLKAFFDDSGTHDSSDVVVMGGIITTEEDWALFEPDWNKKRDELGIEAMHMAHCENGRGEFAGWAREARDAAISDFSDLVCDTHGRMLASAVSRAVWKSVVARTALGKWFSDPIDFLFNTCMRRALISRREDGPDDEQVEIVFDAREQNIAFWRDLASGYEGRWPDRVAGFSFGSMKKVLPLQAADMVAYEAFVHQCRMEKFGENAIIRPNFLKLQSHLASYSGFYTENSLMEYALQLGEP